MPHCGFLSATSRMLEIYRALRQRGVAARIATHGGTYEHVLRDVGVPYDIVGPRMTPERCARFIRDEIGMGYVGQSMYTDREMREYVAAETEYFRRHDIRTVVTGFTLTTLLSTRLAGAALVTEHAGSWVPPVFERGLLPAPSQAHFGLLPARLLRRLSNALPPRVGFYCGGFNRLAAELGVPPVPSLASLVLGDLALIPEVPEVLGVPATEVADWRPNGRSGYRAGTRLRCVGPLYARLDLPLPDRVARFLAEPGPVVYVAVNSTEVGFVRRVVTTIAALPVRVLVAGTHHDLHDMADDRVMVGGVLPSHLIMPAVDLAVTAGGQGSVQTAMAGGTPVLGFPLQPEQDLNLALLERIGAARLLAPRHVGARLAALVTEMLADPSYREAAQRVQRWYAATDGPANAAEAILAVHDADGADSIGPAGVG
ncbi:glycosyltransferase [Micromonospora ureilytica]|uniref:UDP:flavonoid glycosyltransferase YjiC (YdhE family) n=1 Tax=Micromonospora ureilytica TaxID=709868 RepID=A0ABS0JDU1_9ACTN|nr:nucleotide disphospho-sugar-binding domain-containing protein [Micromonospora ureilytica]MBG6064691.1 UDP:flavonoid glycosyltransferase YjiC (YdhE family) [Micromonospora ureilytica]